MGLRKYLEELELNRLISTNVTSDNVTATENLTGAEIQVGENKPILNSHTLEVYQDNLTIEEGQDVRISDNGDSGQMHSGLVLAYRQPSFKDTDNYESPSGYVTAVKIAWRGRLNTSGDTDQIVDLRVRVTGDPYVDDPYWRTWSQEIDFGQGYYDASYLFETPWCALPRGRTVARDGFGEMDFGLVQNQDSTAGIITATRSIVLAQVPEEMVME